MLDQPFTVDGGELTPTMKVKRAHVIATRAAEVKEMYEGRAGLVSYSTENLLDLAAMGAAAP